MPKRSHPPPFATNQNTSAYDYGGLPFICKAIEETPSI
jgi:hypothetical protein